MTNSYLIDLHVVIWWFAADPLLSTACVRLLEDGSNRLLFSSASIHEFIIKDTLEKMPLSTEDFINGCAKVGLEILALDWASAKVLKSLPMFHKDPFDRALIAQAMSQNTPLISADQAISQYQSQNLKLINPSE